MAIVKKKLWKEYFDAVVTGDKKAEFRLGDTDIQPGDTLILEEWDKDKKEYTGRSTEKRVTYVSRFKLDDIDRFWTKEEVAQYGVQIISME